MSLVSMVQIATDCVGVSKIDLRITDNLGSSVRTANNAANKSLNTVKIMSFIAFQL